MDAAGTVRVAAVVVAGGCHIKEQRKSRTLLIAKSIRASLSIIKIKIIRREVKTSP